MRDNPLLSHPLTPSLSHPAIRPAREEDRSVIRAMVHQERLDPTQLRWQQYIVAETKGQIIGAGQLRRYGNVAELGSLVVMEAWRMRGIGGALVRALIER